MKVRFCKDKVSGRRCMEIRIRSQSPVRDVPKDSALLEQVRVSRGPMGVQALRYATDGTVRLRHHLVRTAGTEELLRGWLQSLARALTACRRNEGCRMVPLCDDRYVRVDGEKLLRFAAVPLEEVAQDRSARASPLGLLRAFAQLRSQADPSCEELKGRLAAFVDAQEGIFLPYAYLAFAQSEQLSVLHAVDTGAASHAYAGGGDGATSKAYVISHAEGACRLTLREGQRIWIGRSAACDVVLEQNMRVSRRHASVEVANGSVVLEDNGSANGTFAQGRRLAAHERASLPHGGSFSLAGERFCVVYEGEEGMR